MKPDSECVDLRRAWMESDIGDPATRRATLDSRHQAHLGACVSCAALTHNEARAVAHWRRETEQVSALAPPPLARIVGAARERARAEAAWRSRLRSLWILAFVVAQLGGKYGAEDFSWLARRANGLWTLTPVQIDGSDWDAPGR